MNNAFDWDRLRTDLVHDLHTRGLNRDDAAAEIGCAASTLSRFVNGSARDKRTETETTLAICMWLGIDIWEYWGKDGDAA